MSRLIALLPASLLALGAFWSGGFESSTRFPNGPVGIVTVLLVALLAARELPDPLRLGRWGALWAPALVVVAAASWAASPIPRAGRVALAVLPAFLLLPAVVARVWSDSARRRAGVAAWSAVVAAVAVAAIVESAGSGWGRAAAPLGHHNLLGAFLAMTLPVAAVGLRENGAARAISFAATLLGAGALVATRSLGALVALAAVALVASLRLVRGRELVVGLALLGLGLAVPRVERILRGDDPSLVARQTYAEAALAGARERWLFGWGPGAIPWTLAGFLRPRPGHNPAGELVGEPHSTPLRIAYELGLAGLLVTSGLLLRFGVVRWRERAAAPDLALLAGGAAGLAAGFLCSLSGSWLAVPALPATLAASAGAALAGGAPPAPRRLAPGAAAIGLYLVGAASILAPTMLAQRDYREAIESRDPGESDRALARAAARDPDFPLYRARLAWHRRDDLRAATDEAVAAAGAALGVAPLWLRAGFLAVQAERPESARAALVRAMALDPLSGGPPFALFVASGGADIDCAARAIVAEPALVTAIYWRSRLESRISALELARSWPGIDPGWRAALAKEATGAAARGGTEEGDLVYRIDGQAAVSASLHLFRRPAWPAELLRIRIDRKGARAIRLPSAAALATSSRDAFPPRRCAPGG